MFKIILFLLILGTVSYLIYSTWRKKDRVALLRQNPAELLFFAGELPSDFMDSNVHMAKFYASMRDLLIYNEEQARQGLGVLHIGIYVQHEKNSAAPVATFFIACDAEKVNDVKARLGTAFGNDLVLSNLEEHPFKEELEKSRAAFPVRRPFQDWHDKREAEKAEKAIEEQIISMAKQQGMSDEEIEALLIQTREIQAKQKSGKEAQHNHEKQDSGAPNITN